MNKILQYTLRITLLFCIVTGSTSCSKEEKLDTSKDIYGLGGEPYVETPVDKWLYENFVKEYNIDVKYRFNQFELDLNKTLVPIKEEIVTPVMDIIKNIWVIPYEQLTGATFIKKLSPKKFVLVGSPQYNGGTITLGEAEGGRKIVIFRLNWFNIHAATPAEIAEKKELIQSVMKTVHHEFIHTMHQTIMYPEDFMNITPGGYTSSWTNVSDKEALKLGYISPYACANSNEDFAETISRILVYGREAFNKRVADASAIYRDPKQNQGMTYDPGVALRQKEEMAISYLKDVWNVDLYDPTDGVKGLETLVQEAIAASLEISNN